MPFSASNSTKYNKKLKSNKDKRRWASIANSVLKRCMSKGGSDQSCSAKAIRQANGVLAKK